MGLMNKARIIELSTPPTFVATMRGSSFYTRWTVEQIAEHNTKHGMPKDSTFWMHYRELTTEERANWRPLIGGFIPEVRDEYHDPFPGMGVDDFPRKTIPFGMDGESYIVRLGKHIRTPLANDERNDPLWAKPEDYITNTVTDFLVIPPFGRAIGTTVEDFQIPNGVSAIVTGHALYTRCGAIVTMEPLHGGCSGHADVNIFNASTRPLMIYADAGVAHLSFVESNNY